jgi:ankyrin repeat protein
MKIASVLVVALLFISTLVFADEGRTARLMVAAGHGDTDAVRKLLDEGAKVNETDEHGFTALMFAARSGKSATVHLLLERGADVNVRARLHGYTALMLAAAFGGVDMVADVLARGARINDKNADGATALAYATEANKHDTVVYLRAHGGKK